MASIICKEEWMGQWNEPNLLLNCNNWRYVKRGILEKVKEKREKKGRERKKERKLVKICYKNNEEKKRKDYTGLKQHDITYILTYNFPLSDILIKLKFNLM